MSRRATSGRSVGGLVLAGGRGVRFGRPKASVELGGVTLAQRAVDVLRAFCDDVVVVSRAELPRPAVDAVVVDDLDGPPSAITGLWSGLNSSDAEDVLVLACDLLVRPALIERLLAAPGDAAVAFDDHGGQPLCGRYRRASAVAACQVLRDDGDLRARRLIELLAPTPVTIRPGELRNVNTWPDAFAASLGVPALSPEAIELILILTRDVAHGTERLNGPLASFLTGLAAGQGAENIEAALNDAITAAHGLLPHDELES